MIIRKPVASFEQQDFMWIDRTEVVLELLSVSSRYPASTLVRRKLNVKGPSEDLLTIVSNRDCRFICIHTYRLVRFQGR